MTGLSHSLQPGFSDRKPRFQGMCPLSHLIHCLPHEVLLHGDVQANQLLHGAAQQAVVEEFVQILLVLWGTAKKEHSLFFLKEDRSTFFTFPGSFLVFTPNLYMIYLVTTTVQIVLYCALKIISIFSVSSERFSSFSLLTFIDYILSGRAYIFKNLLSYIETLGLFITNVLPLEIIRDQSDCRSQ